jgi:hypothetical protein
LLRVCERKIIAVPTALAGPISSLTNNKPEKPQHNRTHAHSLSSLTIYPIHRTTQAIEQQALESSLGSRQQLPMPCLFIL